MINENAFLRHRGDKTVIEVPKNEDGLESFKAGLQEVGFVLMSRRGAIRRPTFLCGNFGTIQIFWETRHNSYVISVAMILPGGWVWIPVIALIVAASAACGYLAAVAGMYSDTAAVFVIIAAAVAALVIYIIVSTSKSDLLRKLKSNLLRKFDCSPTAYWMSMPRRIWYKRLKRLIEGSFQIAIEET